MASRAAFKIRNVTTGGAWSPSTDRGFDASAGDTVALKLEADPALDVQSARFFVDFASKAAPVLSIPVPTPPTVEVQVVLGAGTNSWLLHGETNGGGAVKVHGLDDFTVNNFSRIISVRSPAVHLRKNVVVETIEYSATGGWADAQNEMVDATDGAVVIAAPVQVKARLCATGNQTLTGNPGPVDGVTIANGDVVLCPSQSSGPARGVYIVNTSGAWTRHPNANTGAALVSLIVTVSEGVTLAESIWQCTTDLPITVGVTSLTWKRLPDSDDLAVLASATSEIVPTTLVLRDSGGTFRDLQYRPDYTTVPDVASSSGVYTEATLTYTSSIDPALTTLTALYTHDNGVDAAGGLMPILLVMHGYNQDATYISQTTQRRMARGGFAVVAPHMRGRGGNPGTADDSARELQDIVDAIDAAVAAQPSKLDPTRVFVVGYSGGGANAIALAAKYPGRFIAIFSFFGWGDYGVNTMGNAFETTSAVSYWGSKDSPGVLAARIGPRSDLLAYRARNVHPMIGAAISQASTKLLMFWAPTDPIGNCLRKVRDTLIDCGAPLTRWYAEADAKWAHGYPDTNPLLIDAEAPLRRMVNDPAPTTRLSGTIEISGHCVHGNVNGDGWRLWTADPESADAELDPAGGRRHRVRCTFDTTTMQYLVSPLSGACTVTIKQTVLAPLTDSINGHAHGVRIVTKLVDTADTPFDLANGLLTIVPDALHCYEAEVGIAKSGASILSWTGRDGKGGPAVPVAAVPTYSAANPYHPAVLFAQSGNDRLRADGSPLLSGTESFGIACRFSGTAGNGMMAGCSYSDVLGVSNQWIAIIGDDAHFYGAISTSLGDITLTFSGYGYTTLNPNLVILERVGTTLWLTVGDEATVSVTNAFIGGTITATRLNIGELDRSAGFSELYPLAGSVSHLMSVVGRRFTNPERRELWRYTRSLGVVS